MGEDQTQHVELTRDLAERFNQRYGPAFVVPRRPIRRWGARVMDLQEPGAKMGKSHESGAGIIYLLDEPEVVRRKVMRALTDSGREVRHEGADARGHQPAGDPGGVHRSRSREAGRAVHLVRRVEEDTAEAVEEVLRPVGRGMPRWWPIAVRWTRCCGAGPSGRGRWRGPWSTRRTGRSGCCRPERARGGAASGAPPRSGQPLPEASSRLRAGGLQGGDEGGADAVVLEFADGVDGGAGRGGDGLAEFHGCSPLSRSMTAAPIAACTMSVVGLGAGQAEQDAGVGHRLDQEVEVGGAGAGEGGGGVLLGLGDAQGLADAAEDLLGDGEVRRVGVRTAGDHRHRLVHQGGRVGHDADHGGAGGQALLEVRWGWPARR